MTSTVSLFASAPADVTLERIQELVGQDPPESLTLEFKEKYSPGVLKSIAAMANTYGGLILIGVTDRPGPNGLVGVPDTAVVQIANAYHEALSHRGSRRSFLSADGERRPLYPGDPRGPSSLHRDRSS